MLVKNLLKRGLSVLICAVMLAVMFTSVTALADNYEITQSTFTDELENTNFLYSYPNDPRGWQLIKNDEKFTDNGNPVSGFKVGYAGATPGWSIDESVNITYKAGGNKKFTKATFTIWINDTAAKNGYYPIVKAKKADADSEFETVSTKSDWTILIQASPESGTDWFSKAECTVYFPDGAVEAGLGFKLVDGVGVGSSGFIFDKAEFMTGNEVTNLDDKCSSLDNMWLYKELQVVDDKSGEVNYNNGGKMIGMTGDWAEWEAVYKVPDGRNFKSAFFEISRQDDDGKEPKIAYSVDGINYTNFTFSWNKTDTSPSPGSQNNAGWSKIWTADVSVPKDANNIKFIKLYYGDEGNKLRQYQFYLRKVNLAISSYSLFKEVDGNKTNLNGKAENGNLFGKIYYTPKDGETEFYTIIALKENGIIKNIELKNITGVTSATNEFETPVLENCAINDNTVVEVYLFNMTDGSLKPVLSEKGEFSK